MISDSGLRGGGGRVPLQSLTVTNNQVNLPGIVQGSEGTLRYYITYGGERIATWGLGTKRHYLGEAEYKDNEIQHIVIPNGRLNLTTDEPQLEYHLTDHLGNIVVYFSDSDGDGEIATEEQTSASDEAAEVLQRNYYYPFGLRVESPSFQNLGDPENRYLYNGKELQTDLGMGWLYYGARMYDAEIGRFTGVDPLASEMANWNPYIYTFNNPIRFVDPDGRKPEDDYKLKKNGKLTLLRKTDSDNHTIYNEEESASIEVEKNVISDLQTKTVADGKHGKQIATSFGTIKGSSNAKRIFKFFADNSDVEFGLTTFDFTGTEVGVITTSHDEMSNYSQAFFENMLLESHRDVSVNESIHSHPTSGPHPPSGFYSDGTVVNPPFGDRGFYMGMKKMFGKRSPDLFGVYIPSKSEYYLYDSESYINISTGL